MARKTKTTTTPKDSAGAHAGKFSGAVAAIRAPGEVDASAGTTPQAIKNAQTGVYSSYHMNQADRVHTSLPVAGLDTDTN